MVSYLPAVSLKRNVSKNAVPIGDARALRGRETRARILEATRSELRVHGQDLTLELVAARLGLTKQAVLYHFPSKERLFVELALIGIAEEADAMIAAVAPARSGSDAIRRFLHASYAFHVGDLERFRLTYIRPQVVPGAKDTLPPAEREQRLYPVTSGMYAALEEKLASDRRFPAELQARPLAVAVHLAAIGFVTMAGNVRGAKDSMKLPFERYIDQLAAALSRSLGDKKQPRRSARIEKAR